MREPNPSKSDSVIIRDRDIREPLFDFLKQEYGKIRILEEKPMGRSRADMLMVTEDALFGIEIKSDADSYARLSRQVRDYNLYFDYNYVVVGTTHAHHIGEHVPAFWGIITVEQDEEDPDLLDFYILRRPERNTGRDMLRKLSFLWRSELTHILASEKLPKYVGKSKRYVAGKMKDKIDEERLDRLISEELFQRDYTVYGDK